MGKYFPAESGHPRQGLLKGQPGILILEPNGASAPCLGGTLVVGFDEGDHATARSDPVRGDREDSRLGCPADIDDHKVDGVLRWGGMQDIRTLPDIHPIILSQ